MTTTIHSVHKYTIKATVDDEEIQIETAHAPGGNNKPLVHKRVSDGHWIVGYLVQDEDCSNPLTSSDGMGRIYTHRRSSRKEERQKFRDALGLNEDGVQVRKPEPLAVRLDCYEHGGEVWAVSNSPEARSFPDQQWDVSHGVGLWVPDDCCTETIWYNTLASFLPKEVVDVGYHSEAPYGKDGKGYLNRILVNIRVGAPLRAVQNWKSRTQAGALPDTVTLRPQGYKSFRTATEAALRFFGIKPDKQDVHLRLRNEALKIVRGVVEEYNKWLSGDCWGVVVEEFDEELNQVNEDSCWGYIGSEYAEETLADNVKHAMKVEKDEQAASTE